MGPTYCMWPTWTKGVLHHLGLRITHRSIWAKLAKGAQRGEAPQTLGAALGAKAPKGSRP